MRGNFDTRLGAAARWAPLHGPPKVKLHVAVGLAIGAAAITLAVLAVRSGERSSALFALLGLVMAASAGIRGAAFLAYHQHDTYSLLMSVGFPGSLFACWTGLLVPLNKPWVGTAARQDRPAGPGCDHRYPPAPNRTI